MTRRRGSMWSRHRRLLEGATVADARHLVGPTVRAAVPQPKPSQRLDAAEAVHRWLLAERPKPRRYRLPGEGGWWVPQEDEILLDRTLVPSAERLASLRAARLRGATERDARRDQVYARPELIGTRGFDRREMAILRATEADDLAIIAAARRAGGA